MSTLLYGMVRAAVPADEKTVRSTTEYVDPMREPAAMPDTPEFDEVETDPNPNLGMVNRQLASHWTEREQYSPGWASAATAITDQTASVNRRQAEVGTAASRETSGQFGHGTMAFAVGIEPTLNDGQPYGTDYFEATQRGVQEDVRTYLNPPTGTDRDSVSAVGGAARAASRDSAAAGLYDSWYAAMVGGGR